jgi:hypothetical protein
MARKAFSKKRVEVPASSYVLGEDRIKNVRVSFKRR